MKKVIEILKKDKRLSVLVEKFNVPKLQQSQFIYKDLIRSIISQQLSIKAADKIYGRYCIVLQNELDKPENLLLVSFETLRSAGLSKQKSNYVKNVSEFFLERNLINFDWSTLSDNEAIRLLTEIKGVGLWTAQMVLMFSLARENIFPYNDLSIQQKMKNLYEIKAEGKDLIKEMIVISENWNPYKTYACMLLWQWKDFIN